MSSYVCEPKHFNSIQGGIYTLLNYTGVHRLHFPYELRKIFPHQYSNDNKYIERRQEIKNVVDTLAKINVLTVCLQYKDKYIEGTLDAAIKEDTEQVLNRDGAYKSLTPAGLFKAIQCLDYQIEIEHLTNIRELTETEINALAWLKAMRNKVAEYIVINTPDYEKADWGID